jgi:drug/metabolite transporter (DMT)-like permease
MKKTAIFNIIFYSFFSGFLACLVSIFVKFAFNTHLIVNDETINTYLRLLIQVAFICISIALNGLMWVYYTKGLHSSANTLYSTALNKFSNFVCSALFGYLIFNERINLTSWLFGLFILLIGILILNDQEQERIKEKNGKLTAKKEIPSPKYE